MKKKRVVGLFILEIFIMLLLPFSLPNMNIMDANALPVDYDYEFNRYELFNSSKFDFTNIDPLNDSNLDNALNVAQINSTHVSPANYEFALRWYDGNPYKWNSQSWLPYFSTVAGGGGDEIEGKFNRYFTSNQYFKSYIDLQSSSTSFLGIDKDDLTITGNDINVTFQFCFIDLTDPSGYWKLTLYSADNTEIVRLRFQQDSTNKVDVEYQDAGSSWNHLVYLFASNIGGGYPQDIFTFNLHIFNYDAHLRYYKNHVFNDSYVFSLKANKYGLKRSEFVCRNFASADGLVLRMYLDYMGFYKNNESRCDDIGTFIVPRLQSEVNNYNFRKFYLHEISFNHTSDIKFMGYENYGYDPIFIVMDVENETVVNWENNVSYSETINYYDKGNYQIPNGYLYIQFNGTLDITQLDFYIHGIKVSDISGEIAYNKVRFEYSNININDSYFWVGERNHRLYYSMDITQDSTEEFMQLILNVENTITVNRSISFRGYYNGIASGYLRVNYTDTTSSIYSLLSSTSHYGFVLPQDKVLGSFVLMVTDNNEDTFTNTTTWGRYYDLTLVYNPELQITYGTTSLIIAMIPLAIIIAITLALRESTSDAFIIPLFIFLTVILYIGGNVPLWILFITIIALGMLGLMESRGVKSGEL